MCIGLKDIEHRPCLELVQSLGEPDLPNTVPEVVIFHCYLDIAGALFHGFTIFEICAALWRAFKVPPITDSEVFENVVHDDDVAGARTHATAIIAPGDLVHAEEGGDHGIVVFEHVVKVSFEHFF